MDIGYLVRGTLPLVIIIKKMSKEYIQRPGFQASLIIMMCEEDRDDRAICRFSPQSFPALSEQMDRRTPTRIRSSQPAPPNVYQVQLFTAHEPTRVRNVCV